MLKQAIDFYKRLNPKPQPENSYWLRLAVLGAVLVSVMAVVSQGYFSSFTNIGAPVGIAFAYWVSWSRRDKANWWLKSILSVAVLVVTGIFLVEVSQNLYDTRIPLAKLFLWIQVLHSFDLPSRRDLQFSLVSALVLISVAGILSLDTSFAIFLFLFALFSLIALFLMHASELNLRVVGGREVFKGGAALAALAGVIFLLLPRFPGMKVANLPVSFPRLIPQGFQGQVINQSYPTLSGRLPMSPPRYLTSAYPGFAPVLDLRMRGRLSDDVMMKVRSTRPVYHRALVFDRYTGRGWEITRSSPKRVSSSNPPIILPIMDARSYHGGREVISSYYIERNQPNIIFASYQPSLLYFPATAVWIDRTSSLKSGFTLDSDIVYSVVSRWNNPDAESLRSADPVRDQSILSTYTQLPSLPNRVEELSFKITRGKGNSYDKAMAILDYLESHYRYDLNMPFQRGKGDAVDYFLFEEKRGYCDQFASSFVVMARLNGMPARLVTGYTTGTYNPFTGYYEIRASDAHSWVEVYFSKYGWISFDPTPAAEVPQVAQGRSWWIWGSLAQYFKVSQVGPFLAKASRYLSASLFLTAFVVALILLVRFVGPKLRRRRKVLRPTDPRSLIVSYFQSLCQELALAGLPRKSSQTPGEYALSVERRFGGAFRETQEMARQVEKVCYSTYPIDSSDAERAHALYLHLLDKLPRKH